MDGRDKPDHDILGGAGHACESGSCGRCRLRQPDGPADQGERGSRRRHCCVDYDEAGRIVGVEILDVSKRTEDPEVLKHYSFDVPAVG